MNVFRFDEWKIQPSDQEETIMKKIAFFAALICLLLALPALAQENGLALSQPVECVDDRCGGADFGYQHVNFHRISFPFLSFICHR